MQRFDSWRHFVDNSVKFQAKLVLRKALLSTQASLSGGMCAVSLYKQTKRVSLDRQCGQKQYCFSEKAQSKSTCELRHWFKIRCFISLSLRQEVVSLSFLKASGPMHERVGLYVMYVIAWFLCGCVFFLSACLQSSQCYHCLLCK